MVELLVGLVVIVTVLGAILQVCLQHSKERMLAREIQLAFVACRNNLEELRSVSFADIPALDATGFDVRGENGSAGALRPLPGDPDGLPGRFRVVTDQSSGDVVQYHVVAEVDWSGALGRQHFSLEILLGRRK